MTNFANPHLKVCRILGGGKLSSVKRYEIDKVLQEFPTFSISPVWKEKNVILGESLALSVGFCDPSKDVAEHFVELWGLVVYHAQFPDGGHTIRAQSTRFALRRHRSA